MGISIFNKLVLKNQSKIAVIGSNSENINKICEILQLKSYEYFKIFNDDFLNIAPNKLQDDIWAVIINIKDVEKIEQIIDRVNKIFTNDCIKIVLSNSDSIKITSRFLTHNIIHLNIDYQLNEIPNKLSNDYHNLNANFIKIGVLGCKGGIGNSLIAFNVANKIYEKYLSKTLLVQGVNSSFNVDYFANVQFEKELINDKGLSFYKENSDNAYEFNKDLFKDFNFLVFDHSICSLSKEGIENVLNSLDSVIVVFSLNPTSLRKAKEIYKINEFLLSVQKGCKRMILCCNNLENSKTLLDKNSINEVLGKEVDVFIPYKNLNLFSKANKLPRQINNALNNLVSKLLGDENIKTKRFFR